MGKMPGAQGIVEAEPLSKWSRRLWETVWTEGADFPERLIWIAESFRQTEEEPFREIRVAKAVAHLFENMPILIREGEILAGWHPNGCAGGHSNEEVKEADKYLCGQNWNMFVCEGHLAPDYPTALEIGLDGIRSRIEERADSSFREACGIALKGFQHFICRYADLAGEMAESCGDPRWKGELREMSRICRRNAVHPPETLREAVQLVWFVLMCVAMEGGNSHHCFGPGRLDQYLHRFYVAERRAGTLDEDLLDEILNQFFIKCNEFEGRHMSALIMVVGGRKSDGSDGVNELSYKMLETSDRVRAHFPGIDVSWHEDIDPEFMRRAVQLLRNGKGHPSFFNSDVIVKGLIKRGVSFEHAVDHLPSTCAETSIMGRSNPNVAWPYINIPMCLLYAICGGRHPLDGTSDRFAGDVGMNAAHVPKDWKEAVANLLPGEPQTYDEMKSAFMKILWHAAEGAAAQCQTDLRLESIHRPFPLLSCFIEGCIEQGLDISRGGALYNFIQPEAVGVSNVVDGLAAVKTLVEDSGRFTMDDFRAAVRADFEGCDELRKAILKDCPKHGNDVDWINDLFAEVAGDWCSAFEKKRNFLGGPFLPGFLGWTVWIGYGERTPATPDGRKSGAPLANSMVNCTGTQVKGFPSVVLSTSKFDQSRGLGGTVFNARFQANALEEEKGVESLKGMIEGAFDIGCFQMQVNLTSTQTMRAAQESPEEYEDLLVRIGGYLVPFTLLPGNAQEEVIARTELGM